MRFVYTIFQQIRNKAYQSYTAECQNIVVALSLILQNKAYWKLWNKSIKTNQASGFAFN